jgi:large subunit ribosomal protein L4
VAAGLGPGNFGSRAQWQADRKHALIIFGDDDANFFRAARNLAAHKLLSIVGLNVYDVLNYDELLMTTKTAKAIEARLGGAGK